MPACVLKTDVAWVGDGYSFGLNGVADVAHIMPYYGSDARPSLFLWMVGPEPNVMLPYGLETRPVVNGNIFVFTYRLISVLACPDNLI